MTPESPDEGTAESGETSRPQRPTQTEWSFGILLAVVLVSATVLRVVLFARGHLSFNADMADGGIGALRLLHGGPHSVFVPGQNYNGDLWSYYFLPFHMVFPPSVALLCLGVIPLTLTIGVSLLWMVQVLFRSRVWAFATMAIFLFPSPMVLAWTIHSGSHYIFVFIGISLGTALLARIVQTFDTEGWSRSNALRLLLFGFICGFCHWAHFCMLIFFVAVAMTLLLFPAKILKLAGVWSPLSTQRRGWDHLSGTVQLILLAVLVLLTRVLIAGSPNPEHPNLFHLLISAMSLSLLRCLISVLTPDDAPRRRLIPLLFFPALWIGALPVIWYIHGTGREILNVGGFVQSWAEFTMHLRAALLEGFPVLLGFRHDHGNPVLGVPFAVRVSSLGLGGICLVGLPFAAAIALRRKSPAAFGLTLACSVLLVQMLVYSASVHAWFAANPRYLLLVYWSYVITLGGFTAWLMKALPLRLKWLGTVPLLLQMITNVWLCFDMPRREIAGWSGEDVAERALIEYLKDNGYDHVSCRFDSNGHWPAHELTYIAQEDVIFAPSAEPGRARIRNPQYQVQVDQADSLVYLMPHGSPDVQMWFFLTANEVSFEVTTFGAFTVFSELEPDILHDMTLSEYEALSPASVPAQGQ